MSVFSIFFLLVLIFVIFGIVIWLVQKLGQLFLGWNKAADIPNNRSQRVAKNSSQTTFNTGHKNSNSDNLAGKMLRQQNRKSRRQRTQTIPAESNEQGVQYSPDGPLFHTRHYRSSHITDGLVNEPHSYRRNNHTYGGKNFNNYERAKQNSKSNRKTNKKAGKNQTMMDAVANSYAESMKYSEGYQQAVKRSKK